VPNHFLFCCFILLNGDNTVWIKQPGAVLLNHFPFCVLRCRKTMVWIRDKVPEPLPSDDVMSGCARM
jgi:hypothetical protein